MSAVGVTPGRVLRSEWIKLRSLRSTTWTLAASVAVMVGVSVLLSLVIAGDWDTMTAADRTNFEVDEPLSASSLLAQLMIGVVGVIAVTGEYATGMIRATLAAVPRRLPVLWAKLGLLAAVTFVLMTVAAFASWFGGAAILSAHWDVSLSQPGMLRAVLGSAVVLTAVCLLGVALGFILRSTPAAISVLFAVLLVVPMVGGLVPDVSRYLPSEAMSSFVHARPSPDDLAPLPALALIAGYVAVAIAAAAFTLTRKDA
jgi:hypothetical protein